MLLDDGAADGESDTHTVALRRVEGLKQVVHTLAIEARASIAHSHAHAIAGFPRSSDQHLPRTIVHVNHRVRAVAEQVEDNLLELDTIAGNVREIVGEL